MELLNKVKSSYLNKLLQINKLYLILIFIFIFFYIIKNNIFLCLSLLSIWIFNVIYSLIKINKRYIFLIFNVIFFLFLMGQICFDVLLSSPNIQIFDNNIIRHTLFCLGISLITLFVVTYLFNDESDISFQVKRNVSLEMFFFLMFCVSSVFVLIKYFEMFLSIKDNGYLFYYTQFQTTLPSIVYQIANLYQLAFYSWLALFPPKKYLYIGSIIFLIISLCTMLNGQRGTAMINLVLLLTYYFIRDHLQVDEKTFFTKKKIIVFVFLGFICMLVLNYINLLRYGNFENLSNPLSSIFSFIYNNGGSYKVISYQELYKDYFQTDKIYCLYPLEYMIKNNILTRMFFNPIIYTSNTIEMATLTNNFSEAISYIVLGERYLLGEGLGGCYIAEIYCNFNYLGVLLINALYAIFMIKIPKLIRSNYFIGSLVLLSLSSLYWAPRSHSLEFISKPFESSNIFIFLGIFILYKMGTFEYINNKLNKIKEKK